MMEAWFTSASLTSFAFFSSSLSLIISAVLVIYFHDSVRSALSLILAFFSAASLWLLHESEFLAILLLLVYVGAVMVLFLFVIMMVNQGQIQGKRRTKTAFVSWLVGILIFAQVFVVLGVKSPESVFEERSVMTLSEKSNTQALGEELFSNYIYVFELAGVILLLAIVMAIVLTHRQPRGNKTQNPSRQVEVTTEERLTYADFDQNHQDKNQIKPLENS